MQIYLILSPVPKQKQKAGLCLTWISVLCRCLRRRHPLNIFHSCGEPTANTSSLWLRRSTKRKQNLSCRLCAFVPTVNHHEESHMMMLLFADTTSRHSLID